VLAEYYSVLNSLNFSRALIFETLRMDEVVWIFLSKMGLSSTFLSLFESHLSDSRPPSIVLLDMSMPVLDGSRLL
jgi:CheY-like chemotaxis protein